MTAAYYNGPGLRKRQPVAARALGPELGERFARLRENAERLVREPFKGVTTDGNVVPGLNPLATTGVSTESIRAANEFLNVLDPNQRHQVNFDISSDAWRRWWNIHPFLMRHGLLASHRNASRGAGKSMAIT